MIIYEDIVMSRDVTALFTRSENKDVLRNESFLRNAQRPRKGLWIHDYLHVGKAQSLCENLPVPLTFHKDIRRPCRLQHKSVTMRCLFDKESTV